MKDAILFTFITLFFGGCLQEEAIDGSTILSESMAYHDPSNSWENTILQIHVQEPRMLNPHRYSIIKMDNTDNSFSLKRNRDDNISEHIIDQDGNSSVLWNGEITSDTALVNKYRLDPARNAGYREFYQIFYGLPMSLEDRILKINHASETTFNQQACYQLSIELKEPMFSKEWRLFLLKATKEIIGIEIVSRDKPDGGERLYFEKIIKINQILIPRIRHWHQLKDDTYSGTDIIIGEIND